jgi:LysM repeat protein
MRPRSISRGMRELFLASLAIAAGGCSTGVQEPFQTSSITPRPESGMSQEPRRPAPPATYSGPSLSAPGGTAPSYTQAGNAPPTNSYGYDNNTWRAPQPSYAAAPSYQPSYQPKYPPQQAYPPHQPYQPSYQPQAQGYQPQSQQPQPYQPRWQPAPQAQAYAAPITTGSLGTAKSQTVVVREGDTLYGISRRHGVPVAELVTANRIPDGKIQIGQKLVIPSQTR